MFVGELATNRAKSSNVTFYRSVALLVQLLAFATLISATWSYCQVAVLWAKSDGKSSLNHQTLTKQEYLQRSVFNKKNNAMEILTAIKKKSISSNQKREKKKKPVETRSLLNFFPYSVNYSVIQLLDIRLKLSWSRCRNFNSKF